MTTITVMAASVTGKVVLWETNPAHPGGEVYISGDGRAVEVAPTVAVQERLNDGRLIRVNIPEPVVEPSVSPEPVPGYDTMTAAEIVAMLPTLSDDEKAAVLSYETEHKSRTTVLKALQ